MPGAVLSTGNPASRKNSLLSWSLSPNARGRQHTSANDTWHGENQSMEGAKSWEWGVAILHRVAKGRFHEGVLTVERNV